MTGGSEPLEIPPPRPAVSVWSAADAALGTIRKLGIKKCALLEAWLLNCMGTIESQT